MVLDVSGQHVEPVQLGGQGRADGGHPGSSRSPTARAASAVDVAAWVTTPGSWRCRKPRHWAVATGIDTTVVMSGSAAPGGASRLSCTLMTTSRWMSSEVSKASVSTVTFTAPSMEFSMATNPRST